MEPKRHPRDNFRCVHCTLGRGLWHEPESEAALTDYGKEDGIALGLFRSCLCLGQHPSEKKEKAMPRICQGSRNKGSQKWIRHVVNQCPEILNCEITAQLEIPTDDRINWLSPLANDAYAEYQDQEFLALLKADCRNVPLQKFWPKGGPV